MHYPIEQLEYKDNKLGATTANKIEDTTTKMAFVIHIFYSDIWHDEIVPYLQKINIPFDIFVTTPKEMSEEEKIAILKSLPDIHLYQTENRGRDVLPFLQVMDIIGTTNYPYLCKIHTKKSAGRALGTVWRKLLYYDLIGSNGLVSDILDIFEEEEHVGMITGKHTILDSQKYHLANQQMVDTLLDKLDITVPKQYQFAGGTMFWIRTSLLEPILHAYRQGLLVFESEMGQMDGTLAHSIERILGIVCFPKTIVASPSHYKALEEQTLRDLASLVLSRTYVGKDVYEVQREDLQKKDIQLCEQHDNIIQTHQRLAEQIEEVKKRDQQIQLKEQQIQLKEQQIQLKEQQIQLKEQQIQLKEQQISFLTQLTLKRRVIQKIKRVIPDKILIFFGFSPYHALTMPTEIS